MGMLTSLYIGAMNMMLNTKATSWESNPIKQLREKLKLRWNIFEGLDFIFLIMAIPYTVVTVALFVVCLWGVLKFFWSAIRGNKPIADKSFWIRIAVVLGCVFLVFSGLFWDILEAMYSWTSKQDVTGIE